MLNAHDGNTCLLTSRESKFGSFLYNSKMTCLLSLEVTVATTSEQLLLQSGVVADLCLLSPFMWSECGNSVPSFIPRKWGKKKVGRSQEWRKGGKEARRKGGKKEELPNFVFRVYVLKGCLSRFVYSSSFWVLSLPWYLPFLEVSGSVERLSLAINLTIDIYFPKEVICTSNGEESAYAPGYLR